MKHFKLVLISLLAVGILGGCAQSNQKDQAKEDQELKIVATNSILADMVETVGQEHVKVHSIVPVGTDPHEYEPLPEDIAKATESDIIFYNGLNLETGGNGWFLKLMETSHKESEKDYFATSKGVEPIYLTSKGQESDQDPHAWLSLENGQHYVKNITKTLIEKDPKHEASYKKNSENYLKKLEELDIKGKKEMAKIPKEQALLVTSEGAFKYFSKAYGLEAAYIWEINTDDQGTPDQMSIIIDKIRASHVPSVFVETSVDPRSMESVSRETNVPIYEKIFTDSLAKKGEVGDTYYDMMVYNLDTISKGLTKK